MYEQQPLYLSLTALEAGKSKVKVTADLLPPERCNLLLSSRTVKGRTEYNHASLKPFILLIPTVFRIEFILLFRSLLVRSCVPDPHFACVFNPACYH